MLEWERRCLELAQKTFSVSAEIVPIDHVFTLYTYSRLDPLDDDMLGAYQETIKTIKNVILGNNLSDIVLERDETRLYQLWRRIYLSNIGRRYFSTRNGRLGLGPPEIKKVDTISVFYGTGPAFVLRPAEENREEWYFVGDAFVHGLMELDQAPQTARGVDEVFTII